MSAFGNGRLPREPPDDPNQNQNRVPKQTELNTLRRIRSENRQLGDILKNRFESARQAHERIQARYDQLLEEIEGTRSELNASHKHMAMLEKQEEAIQAEELRLSALLHPIRQCPEDVMRLLFEQAVGEEEEVWFIAATRISHVCRHWRRVALNASSLWKYINISAKDDRPALKLFLQRSFSRVKGTPVHISISDIDEPQDPADLSNQKFLKVLKLDRFPAIASLEVILPTSAAIQQLKHTLFTYSAGPLHKFVISASLASQESSEWDCPSILRRFPTAQSVRFGKLATPSMGGEDKFLSISGLDFSAMKVPTLVTQLLRFPNLQHLLIRGKLCEMNGLAEEVCLDRLLSLEVSYTMNFPWSRIHAPRLQKATIRNKSEDAVAFLCRHISLQQLYYNGVISDASFRKLALSLVDLQILIIGSLRRDSPEQPLLYVDADTPAFPRLKHLELGLFQELPLHEFESLVRSRCLPSCPGDTGEVSRQLEVLKLRSLPYNSFVDSLVESPLLIYFHVVTEYITRDIFIQSLQLRSIG